MIPLKKLVADLIAQAMVNRAFYEGRYQDVNEAGVDPVQHYAATFGSAPIRAPNPLAERLIYRWSPLVVITRFVFQQNRADWLAIFSERLRQLTFGGSRFQLTVARKVARWVSSSRPLPGLKEAFVIEVATKKFHLKTVLDGLSHCQGELLLEKESFSASFAPPSYRGRSGAVRPRPNKLIHIEMPKPFVARLRQVSVRGASRLIKPSHAPVILHDEYAHRSRDHAPKSLDVSFSRQAKINVDIRCPTLELGRAVHLMNEHENNYFHWIVETLPRLVLAQEAEKNARYSMLLNAGLHENLRALTDVVNQGHFDACRVAPNEWTFVEDLIYPSDVSVTADIYRRSPRRNEVRLMSHELREVQRRLLAHFEHASAPMSADIVYLTRGRNNRSVRSLTNEDDLIALLTELGVAILDAGALSLEEQFGLWRNARAIISPTGAALTNMLWARPGTKVVCLMSNHKAMNPYFWQQVAALAEVDLSYVVGPRAYIATGVFSVHDSFSIDRSLLRSVVRDLG